ncbi:MAG: hypothetical protein ACTS1Z_11570 [Parasphingopyxis sp.]|uniref:hypothetical protein n=1 Tax=Parasphingopyxis sp. TaxID=1920299 RepID=UPI003FA039D4
MKKTFLTAIAATAALSLGACQSDAEDRVEDAADEVGDELEDAADNAEGDMVEDSAEMGADRMEEMGDELADQVDAGQMTEGEAMDEVDRLAEDAADHVEGAREAE